MTMRTLARLLALVMPLTLAACATTNPDDPFEGYNRVAFGFNEAVDKVALKPAAEVYQTFPEFVKQGVYNFFSNLDDIGNGFNNVLQGKVADGVSDFGRFAVNTTFGIAGLIDVASAAGFEKHYEDFGQTLGRWGVAAGPYVVLPFLGPSTLRDAAARPVNATVDPVYYVDPTSARIGAIALNTVDQRASLLGATDLLEGAALDRYQFVRDGYLQRRQSQVYDGDPPQAPEEE